MREALKTNISKYGPKTNAAMTVENVQGKGLQLVVIYAGRKHYLPLSSVPMNADTHANHPNHQKIKVDHNGNIGVGASSLDSDVKMEVVSSTAGPTVQASAVSSNSPSFDLRETGGGAKEASFCLALASAHFAADAVDGDAVIRVDGNLILSTKESGGWPTGIVLKDANGNVGINDASPDNQLHVTNTSGVTKEVVKLEQLDDDEPFILFSGTVASDDSNSISSSNGTTGNKIGAVKVAVDGEGVGWIRLYDDAV